MRANYYWDIIIVSGQNFNLEALWQFTPVPPTGADCTKTNLQLSLAFCQKPSSPSGEVPFIITGSNPMRTFGISLYL